MRLLPRLILSLLLLMPLVAAAQQPADSSAALRAAEQADSVWSRQVLEEIDISVQRTPSELSAPAPMQVIDASRIARSGAVQLSDAVQRMVGVTLKDYGGVGGMKTVSARGLGSQFSTLTIDGVAVSDAQNGQVDLGRYLIGNSCYVNLSMGQEENLLLPARVYAAGNVLNMETAAPSFLPRERHKLKVGMETGSFGYFSPSFSWEQKFSKKVSFSLWTNWMQSRGDYPFRLYYTTGHGDSSSIERRTGSQMHMATADANLFYRINPRSRLTVKAHYMQGQHALPGPVTFYAARGNEHSEERLAFAQATLRHQAGDKVELLLTGKCQHSMDVYEDTASLSSITGRLHNEYRQNEGYLSAAVQYSPLPRLRLAASSDAACNTLTSNLSKNNDVLRLSSLNVLAASYSRTGLSLHANLIATLMHEEARSQPADTLSRSLPYRRLSPYIGLSIAPFGIRRSPADTAAAAETALSALLKPLRLRYFYKQTFRVPTFGETYYVAMTRDLRPEQARQHNVGLTYATDFRGSHTALTIDAYRNIVKDKIVAMPIQNMYLWSMVNFGQVCIRGIDVRAESTLPVARWQFTLSLSYAYQQALDKSDSTSKSYNNQLPYTPRHSGGISLWAESPWVDLGYDVAFVGARYSMAQNTESARLDPYADHGVTIGHAFLLRHGTLDLKVRVLNLFNVQYEVVRNYPMMGRNYRLSLTYNY